MTNCAHCGNQNRDGSKFCNNCGARLVPQTGLVCSMCGTANKLESVFCSNCGARLVPLITAPDKPPPAASPIKGLSLPVKPDDSAAERVPEPKPAEPVAAGDDWVARLRDIPTAEEPDAAPAAIPDWLRSAQPAAEIQPLAESEQPDWLREMAAESKSVADPTVEIPVEDMPDWLRAPTLEPQAEEPLVTEWVAATPSEEELPDWARELKPSTGEPPGETPATWPSHGAEIAPGEPLIRALEEKVSSIHASESPTPGQMAEMALTGIEGVEEIPDWLRTAAPAETKSAIQPAVAEIRPAAAGEVPDWIAGLKPAEPSATPGNEPVGTSGPLAGLRGVLPLALAITEPHAPAKPPAPGAHKESAALFDPILAAPGETPAMVKLAPRTWTMRPWIYLWLLLAVLVPFFLPSDWASSSLKINGTPTAEFYDTLQTLPANATVLLAFEYDPGVAGEMDLQAKAITRHLIQRQVKIVTLSTLDTGAPIARRILKDVTRNASHYVAGTNYAHLGYLAGHEAGLANLATTGLPAIANFANLKTLRDLHLIVVLAGSDDTLKAWMEQVQPRAGVRIVAGVSAAVEPKARAYRDTPTRQLTALMSGLIGAAQYEVLSNPNETGLALISVNAQIAAQLVLVLIIVMGNLVHWSARALRRNG